MNLSTTVCVCVCMCTCVPAGRLSQDAGELTLSMDAVVFIAIWTGDGQTVGQSVPGLLFLPYKHTRPLKSATAPQEEMNYNKWETWKDDEQRKVWEQF